MSFLRVRTSFTGVTGSPWLSTMYFLQAAGAPTQANADAAVVKVGTYWTAIKAVMNNATSYTTLPDVAVLETDGTLTGSFATTPQTGTGASATDALPIASQGLVRWLTGSFVSGRQLRGRTFLPALTETASTGGVPTATVIGTINTANTALIAATDPRLAVWSKVHTTVVTVSSASVWTQFAVLRSRRD